MIAFKSARWAAAAFLAIAAACSGKGPTEPVIIPVATVSIVAPPASLQIGASISLSAQAKDAAGVVLARSIVWTSNASGVATVSADGTVTGVSAGTAIITATSEGKSASVTITVIQAPVAGVNVSLPGSQITVGQTAQATAVAVDAAGRPLTGRSFTWVSSQPNLAMVDQSGKVTALAAGGPVSIIATSEGISGSAQLTVVPPVSCSNSTLQLALGEVRTLVGAERSLVCLSGASAAEYVLIPFNSSPTSSVASVQIVGNNVSAPLTSAASLQIGPSARVALDTRVDSKSIENAFRIRERQDLAPALASMRGGIRTGQSTISKSITGIPATPSVGAVFPINVNISGNTCTSAKVLRDARVVAVTTRVIVLIDTQSPANGYTDAELADFGQQFDAVGYGIDIDNFGAPSDFDGNGRIVILFTPSVNAIPGPPGSVVGGLQASRDLFPVSNCLGSNEGEMFYMPVPDPASTINGNYTNKANLANRVQPVLAHEFQHLINAGRRIYVNNAFSFEEVWLNEGLSHIAEELVYYRISGNAPRQNIDLPRVQSSQAQLDAINGYQVQNLGRLRTYLTATELNSPYATNDNLETRGATWELLRYAADRKAGNERDTWFALVNSSQAGQSNFAGVFGSLGPIVRDWAIAQYVDDFGVPVAATYTYPSWNFRSLLPAINNGVFPLVTRTLTSTPLDLSLVGGGAAYVKFRVGAGVTANLTANTQGQAPQATVDLILVRVQ